MLVIKNIAKTYAKSNKPAVDSLSMNIRAGELYGFIGPNGAGKTTTIKMMTGILSPDSGDVLIGGQKINGTQAEQIAAKRLIGYVPDAQDAYDRLTGLEYLNFMADMYRVSEDDRTRAIPKYTELFGIADALRDPVRSYSRGMKQKLTITGALLHNPKLFILDEPMVGLDPHSAHQLKLIMRERVNSGGTVFFSTHVLDVAERLCDRIGIINQGKLIAEGTLEEINDARLNASLDKSIKAEKRTLSGATLEQIFLELTEQNEEAE
ncbi:MAG: ABC transporter ATP-binding protein [Oscillospiraceae bacterium]|jgi:ABC-2 type transport system ATP-binding protein|nr:ABC transporter ATP-binding protein [Oscillospiraceae bacterium]